MAIESSIEKALFKHTFEMDITGDPQLAWPNKTFDPPSTPYVRVMHLPNRNTRMIVKGSSAHFRQGILQLTVVTPLLGGATVATELAAEIAEQFPADFDMYEDGIRVRIQKAPDVVVADKTDTSWDVRVDVYYEAFA